MDRCPPPDDLRRLLAEELSSSEAATVEAHLEACIACQQQLEQLTADSLATTPDSAGYTEGDGAFLRALRQQRPTGLWPLPGQNTRPEAERVPNPAAGTFPGGDRAGRVDLVLTPRPGSRQTNDIPTLLRKRLRFFAAVNLIAFAIYAATATYLVVEADTILMYGLVLALTAGLTWLLWSRRPLSLRMLRWIESLIVGSTALLATRIQWIFYSWDWLARVGNDDWMALMLLARGMSLFWVGLIAAYGLLIPNTWRRSAIIIGMLALWPVLLHAAMAFRDRPLETRLIFVVESAVNMAIAASLALFGSHRIEVLWRQAAEARKVGPYQLKRRLGAGGMGEVYLAEHGLLRRPCAVKLIRPERAGDTRTLRRFEREVQVMATLSHPNTVEIYDYGHAEDGTFYYVMEYLPGLNLEDLVKRHGPLPPERAVHLLRQACGALGEAHGVGLVHRDVKPGNILVGARGGLHDVAKLLDFGLVHVAVPAGETLTQEGMIGGTPAYMSPEQSAGKEDPDGRCDLYSLGAVAWFLLTGQPPFVRATAVETLAAHLNAAVSTTALLDAGVPADLQIIVLRCLAKEPAHRYADAEALDQALAQCACVSLWTKTRASEWWLLHEGDS